MSGRMPRRAWPLLAGAFASGLIVALALPIRTTSPKVTGAANATVRDPGPASSAPGPTAVEDGVPVGFGHIRAGAVAAAASFVCTGQAMLDMDPLAAERAVRRLSASASADALVGRQVSQIAQARSVLSNGTGPIVYRQSAIAWRVDAFDAGRARVAIWSVGVLSRDGVAPPQAAWSTSVVDLVWEHDDWRVWGETVSPGPTPIAEDSDAPATSAQLRDALNGFTDFGAAP